MKAVKNKKDLAPVIRDEKSIAEAEVPYVHIYGNSVVCDTDKRGSAEPRGNSPVELVVDATDGFIPLWDEDVTLRWRFNKQSLQAFNVPEEGEAYLRQIFGEGLLLWKDARPVKFKEVTERWDFEIVMRSAKKCTPNGCTLASAFFPDSGQHNLFVYPSIFDQSKKEQIETMAHEIGHIFGLRHFFADIKETLWASEIFGKHSPFSIMNYGAKSKMTKTDRNDLKELYRLVWSGELTNINGTPISLVRPFSETLPLALAI